MMNYLRIRQMRHVIECGEQRIGQVRREVDTLQTRSIIQEKICERLQSGLDATRALLERTTVEVRFILKNST